MKQKFLPPICCALISVLLLAGCGGGDSNATPPGQTTGANGSGATTVSTSPTGTTGSSSSPASSAPASTAGTAGASSPVGSTPTATAMKQIPVNPAPMGWSSWSSLDENVAFTTIKAQVDGLSALNTSIVSGNKYQYVNIDEGWWTSGLRDANGNFIINVAADGATVTTQWPGGMQAMANYIHSKGLKAGIYIDAGPQGCGTRSNGTRFVGSDFAHYNHDFLQFAQWGFDFVKVDFCGGLTAGYDPQQAYTAISQAIQQAYVQTGQLLTFSICDWGTIGSNSSLPDFNLGPWAWGAGIGAMWRTTSDIYPPGSGVPNFASVFGTNFMGNYHPEGQHTGYYNDPDLMVAGMGMTAANDQTHVSLWAIAGAPMILSNDLSTTLPADTLTLLTNPEVIAIDQDMLGLQGLEVAQSGNQEVWAKLLAGSGQRAVLLFNNSTVAAPITVTWQQLGLVASSSASVQDVWAHAGLGTFTGSYTSPSVPAGGSMMLKLSGTDIASTTFLPSTVLGSATYASCSACANGKAVTGLGTVTFNNVTSQTAGGFVQIAYLNSGNETLKAQLNTNGGNGTTVAFPPTGETVGTITVYVGLNSGQNSLALSSMDSTASTLEITSLAIIGGPVKLQPPSYEAAASSNTLGGLAVVQSCSTCWGGQDVGYIGNGDGTTDGTLSINGISAPTNGTYSVVVTYRNGDSVPRSAQVSFDAAPPVTVTFPQTGGWQNLSTMTVTGTFKQGSANTLMFSNPTGWAPDINGISVSALP